MAREKSIESLLKTIVEGRLQGLCLKLRSDHINGLPDRLCLLPGGRSLFVETKTTGKKAKKIQLLMHQKLRDLGFRVEIIDSKEQIKQLEL